MTKSSQSVFHLSCEQGRRRRKGRQAKQKQEIWRLLLFCTLLAHQVCASVRVRYVHVLKGCRSYIFVGVLLNFTMLLDQYQSAE